MIFIFIFNKKNKSKTICRKIFLSTAKFFCYNVVKIFIKFELKFSISFKAAQQKRQFDLMIVKFLGVAKLNLSKNFKAAQLKDGGDKIG